VNVAARVLHAAALDSKAGVEDERQLEFERLLAMTARYTADDSSAAESKLVAAP
jgi:hypothetical protein